MTLQLPARLLGGVEINKKQKKTLHCVNKKRYPLLSWVWGYHLSTYHRPLWTICQNKMFPPEYAQENVFLLYRLLTKLDNPKHSFVT